MSSVTPTKLAFKMFSHTIQKLKIECGGNVDGIMVFWDVMPYSSVGITDVSEGRVASIFGRFSVRRWIL
jgi:hypothetical protein